MNGKKLARNGAAAAARFAHTGPPREICRTQSCWISFSNSFSRLTNKQLKNFKNYMKLGSLSSQLAVLLVATALIAGIAFGCGSKTNRAAEQAATAAGRKWLAEIDNGQYAQSWQDASAFFQNRVTEKVWESDMNTFRKPLGGLESRNLEFAQYATQLPGAPDGQYVVMRFGTSFANKRSAIETVTFMLETNGQWKSTGFFIR